MEKINLKNQLLATTCVGRPPPTTTTTTATTAATTSSIRCDQFFSLSLEADSNNYRNWYRINKTNKNEMVEVFPIIFVPLRNNCFSFPIYETLVFVQGQLKLRPPRCTCSHYRRKLRYKPRSSAFGG